MFLVFNKEKIQTYIVSVLTVAVLITIANVRKVETIQTSSQEKELPIYNVQTDEKKVAFTMNNVKITFFLVGEWVDKYPEAVKRIAEAGHEIGTHSNTHPHVNKLSSEKNLEEIKLSVNKIEKITSIIKALLHQLFCFLLLHSVFEFENEIVLYLHFDLYF